MPNIKSAEKRVKIAAERREKNMSLRSALRTSLKKAGTSITAGEPDAKEKLLSAVTSLDTAASKGLIHKNQAARRKSRLMKKLNAIAK